MIRLKRDYNENAITAWLSGGSLSCSVVAVMYKQPKLVCMRMAAIEVDVSCVFPQSYASCILKRRARGIACKGAL